MSVNLISANSIFWVIQVKVDKKWINLSNKFIHLFKFNWLLLRVGLTHDQLGFHNVFSDQQ